MESTNNSIDIIVLNYNDYETCFDFYEKVKGYNTVSHILFVDNCSTDDSFEKLLNISSNKVIVIKTNKNGGYSFGNNYGLHYCANNLNSKYVAISNPDVIIEENSIITCLNVLENNQDLIIAAPKMLNADMSLAGCCWNITNSKDYINFNRKSYLKLPHDGSDFLRCDCVAGSFFVAKLDSLKRIGLFDENVFLYCEETILGFRSGRGKSCICLNCNFIHNHSVSINKTIKSEIKRVKLLWRSRLYVLKQYYKASFFLLLYAKLKRNWIVFSLYLKSIFRC